MKLWIFDLDGTLTDSFPLFAESLQEIFASYGKPCPPELWKEFLSHPLQAHLGKYLGEDVAAEAYHRMETISRERPEHVTTYDGVPECLELLKKKGCEISVWTGRNRGSAEIVLRHNGLDRYIDHCLGSHCTPRAKPHADGALEILRRYGCTGPEGVMVGDHLHDMSGARDAGLLPIRASWSPHLEHEICTLSAKQFRSARDLHRWIDEAL